MALPTTCRQAMRLATRCKPSTSTTLFKAQRSVLAPTSSSSSALSNDIREKISPCRSFSASARSRARQSRDEDFQDFDNPDARMEEGAAKANKGSQTQRSRDSDPDAELPELLRALSPEKRELISKARIPKNLQAMYNRPLRRKPTHGIPICNLQIRSFSVRNLELQADFAMRAAYYLGLPAKGPVPLPHITNRWTVPKSNFVHKKSQENFERITVRRLIQIQDGDLEVVQCWLGYLRQRSYHGVGMKAYLWENEGLGVGKRMDESAGITDADLEEEWGNFGMRLNVKTAEAVEELLGSEAFSKPKRSLEAYWREPVEVVRKPTAAAAAKSKT